MEALVVLDHSLINSGKDFYETMKELYEELMCLQNLGTKADFKFQSKKFYKLYQENCSKGIPGTFELVESLWEYNLSVLYELAWFDYHFASEDGFYGEALKMVTDPLDEEEFTQQLVELWEEEFCEEVARGTEDYVSYMAEEMGLAYCEDMVFMHLDAEVQLCPNIEFVVNDAQNLLIEDFHFYAFRIDPATSWMEDIDYVYKTRALPKSM